MRRNSWSVFVAVVGVFTLVLGGQTAGAQGKPEGKIVQSYREHEGQGRPAWVEEALARSVTHLKDQGQALGLRDAAAELALLGADVDDLGQTHVRFNQVKDGIAVFGGQLITHLDASAVLEVGGNVYDSANVDTRPTVNAAQAVKAAKDALGYNGDFANKPDAALVVLPNQVVNQDAPAGSRLTFQVELLVEDGTDRTGRYKYFVDAHTGEVVWSYNTWTRPPGPARACTAARSALARFCPAALITCKMTGVAQC